MSNKYKDLVQIIQKSRENIREALQGNIFEREMLESEVLRGEEAKMRALDELKQRPEVKIVDDDKTVPMVVDDEVKEEEVKEEELKEEYSDDELEEQWEAEALDLQGLDLRPKNTLKQMRQSGINKRYFVFDKARTKINIYEKKSPKNNPVSPGIKDPLIASIPIIRDKILFDEGIDKLKLFVSLLRQGGPKNILNQQIDDAIRIGIAGKGILGKGMDPRLLIGAYLAKNNNKQLENLVMSKILRY